jgi:hypothetical protein
MKNIFNLMKETPEERAKRQAKENPVIQNKSKAIINNAIKEADNADGDSKKGTNQAPISK